MWKIKTWKLNQKEAYLKWLEKNMLKKQVTILFINNGYGVEYRDLKHF